MDSVNVHQAKTHLSALLKRVEGGEEIVIARSGQPIAKLVPLTSPEKTREPGAWKGQIWIAEDFDAPLPDEILDAFEGRHD
ncbi:MAG TPA: type II toxin-antitoxin system Phd/YefM family antitoxin [Thermoanaerobaculia bacterium]|nr:type II toxin-antitoxin system Phd/YefM family antitoxin [Thermoanaerobaculia bacterium]